MTHATRMQGSSRSIYIMGGRDLRHVPSCRRQPSESQGYWSKLLLEEKRRCEDGKNRMRSM